MQYSCEHIIYICLIYSNLFFHDDDAHACMWTKPMHAIGNGARSATAVLVLPEHAASAPQTTRACALRARRIARRNLPKICMHTTYIYIICIHIFICLSNWMDPARIKQTMDPAWIHHSNGKLHGMPCRAPIYMHPPRCNGAWHVRPESFCC